MSPKFGPQPQDFVPFEVPGLNNDGEVIISDDHLEALREVDSVVSQTLAELGVAHLDEKAEREKFEVAARRLKAAEMNASNALDQQQQVHRFVLNAMNLEDGTWDLDLKAGKLVRNVER